MPSSLLDRLAERIRTQRGLPSKGPPSPLTIPIGGVTPHPPVKGEIEPLEHTFIVQARSFIPRQYQIEGIEFLRRQKRAILGDAPGLGKTFQATEAAVLPCVVTCPLPLVDQWREFLEDQYPATQVSVAAYGNAIKRDAAIKAFEKQGGWLIINHDAFRQYYLPTAQTLIADEFHHFRGREAERSKMLAKYAARVERVYGLTATPVYKDVTDLYHQLHILNPTHWSSFWQFLNTYAVTANLGYGAKVLRNKNRAHLERETAPYLLERTYGSVGMQLPDRIDKNIILRMTDKMRKNYNELRDFYRLQLSEEGEFRRLFNAGQVLHELRKMTVTAEKLASLRELVEEARSVENPKPVMIFCWYQETAHQVLAYLNTNLPGTNNLDAVEITGEIDPAKRRELAHKHPVCVVTMPSMSEGIDKSDARTVIFVEEDYTPGRVYQAMSRVIRLRTEPEADADPVVTYWMRYAGTVDQVVHDTAKSRTTHNAMQVLKEALGE